MISSIALVLLGQIDARWDPNAENFRAISQAIQPSAEENSWKRIGWRNAFWPAVQEARRLGRPILLWTMNGHPLGCT